MDGHWMLTITSCKPSLKLFLLQLNEKLPKNSMSTILRSFGIWSKLERWKNLISDCLMSWNQIKRIIILKCLINKAFLNEIVACDVKWILYNQGQPAQWLDQENAPKHFPKPNFHPPKRSRSLFGGLLPVRPATVFWIPVKPLYQRSMLSKLMRCTKNWNAWSQHGQQKVPILLSDNTHHTSHNQCFRSWTNWATKLYLICHFAWPLANRLPLLQASQQRLAGKMLPQREGHRNCFPRVCWILKPGFLCYRNKQTYFSLAILYWL